MKLSNPLKLFKKWGRPQSHQNKNKNKKWERKDERVTRVGLIKVHCMYAWKHHNETRAYN
jgi:hypothetical protein